MKKRIIIEIICLLFIVLFVYAAGTKLVDYHKFTVQLGQSPMLTKWSKFVAWFIPAIEIIISLMLAFTRTQKIALYATLNLMVMFTAYIIIVTKFSPFVPCSCGGILERLGWTEHLYFNLGFVLLAIIGILLQDNITYSKAACVENASESLQTSQSF